MKKYQQLILVILSIGSFVSLLFYRHEYNKLRYVLEVFNFFGTPGVSTPGPSNCSQNISAEKYLMSEPLPAWQRISNTLYVYSAYWETFDDTGHVKAPAIGILNEKLNYGCYLWFESQNEPVKGQFRFSEMPRRSVESPAKNKFGSKIMANKVSKSKGFMFYCDVEKENVTPIGVTFYKISKDEMSQAFLPIYRMKAEPPVQNSTAICVLPNEYTYLKKRNYLEFLSLHRAIGIRDFIIYGGNFQYNVISQILKDKSFDISLMVLQWNYPFFGDFDLMMMVAENDCLLRSSGLFENIIVLKWNQFFVPHSHSSAQSIISNLDPSKKISAFQFNSLIFCLEYNDEPESDSTLPLIFRKTRYSVLKMDSPVYLFKTNGVNESIKKVNKDVVSIHWYCKCENLELKLPDKSKKRFDHSIHAFQSEVLQSSLMRL